MIYATKHILIEILVRLPWKLGEFLKYFVLLPYLGWEISPVLASKPYLRGNTKKWKIFTYIDTIGCSTCNFRALDWKRIIHEADSITSNVTFIFYAHLKNYEEFEVYTGINRFNYPIFYDYEGKCDRQNHLPDDVFYQTFLLDENNKVQLIGKPIPDSKLWELYKKIITQ